MGPHKLDRDENRKVDSTTSGFEEEELCITHMLMVHFYSSLYKA